MLITIEYSYNSININFTSNAPIIYFSNKYYLLVRDEFVKISKITLPSGTQLSPSVIPNWIPISFFEIPKNEIKEEIVYKKFKNKTNSKLYNFDGEEENEIVEFELEYKKIIDKPNCPRYLLYKTSIINDKYNTIVDDKNKLVAIEYGKNEDNTYFLPIYLVIKALTNQKILSLHFINKPIKISNYKIKNHKIFNKTLNNYIYVDTNLLIEGKLNENVNVDYEDMKLSHYYYEIDSINDILLTKEIKANSLGKIQLIKLIREYC